MSGGEHREGDAQLRPLQVAARRLVKESTQRQGLPFHLEDPALLARIAAIIAGGKDVGSRRKSPLAKHDHHEGPAA